MNIEELSKLKLLYKVHEAKIKALNIIAKELSEESVYDIYRLTNRQYDLVECATNKQGEIIILAAMTNNEIRALLIDPEIKQVISKTVMLVDDLDTAIILV